MAKRNKAKFASKSRKSGLRVEALEQRQLLAAVTGGGTEVGSDIQHPNGNVYDQVLMTGSSVTVTADAGQVTRVSYVDTDGDIVQAEFSGKGTMTISLENFGAAAPAANYNQPGVNYVSGLATFTIQGSDASTHFSVFSVGAGNAVNQSLFEGGKTGGDHYADVAALRIVADPQNPGGFSTFGGIRAGNAIFAADTGTVGITAVSVNVQGPVIIGDMDASNAGVPTLNFGAGSQFGTLVVAGGDLDQSNNAAIVDAGFATINSTNGTNSAGETVTSQTIDAAAAATLAGVTITTLDTATAIDLTGKTQAQINELFTGRTFTNEVTIAGNLGAANSINAAEFRGGVIFTGNLEGTVTVDKAISSLTVQGKVANTITADTIGAVSVTSDVTSTITANTIGDVTIGGNLTGLITTDKSGNNAHNGTEGAIGNVMITGNISGSGAIEGVLGIGNISVGGDITSSGANAGGVAGTDDGVFVTASGTAGDAFLGNIGTLTVTGDVDQTGAGSNLINIRANGNFGAVTINGGGSLGKTDGSDNVVIGEFRVGGSLGLATAVTGAINITESASDVTLTGVTIAGGTGSMGALTLTGPTGKDTDLTLGAISAAGMATGDITVTGFEDITTAAITGKSLGGISITTRTGDATDASTITVGGAITSTETQGNIVLSAAGNSGNVDFNAGISGKVLNDVTITAPTVTFDFADSIKATETTGTVTVNGQANISAAAINLAKATTGIAVNGKLNITGASGIVVGGTLGSFTATDDVTLGVAGTNVSLAGVTNAITLTDTSVTANTAQFLVKGSAGSLVLNGTTTFAGNTTGVATILFDDGKATRDTVGSVSINGRITGGTGGTVGINGDIVASSIGDVTISSKLTQDQVLVTNLDIIARPNGGDTETAEKVAVNGSDLGNYGIGNVSVSSQLDLAYTGTRLFSGDNFFVGLGKIGDVTLTGASSGAQQTSLFTANTDGAWFVAGDTDGLNNQTALMPDNENILNTSNAGIGTTAGVLTGGTVTVGNVSVNARQTLTAGGYSGVDAINGSAGSGFEGLAVLSGVRAQNADGAAGDVITMAAANSLVNMTDIDGDVKGTIGTVLITSNNAVAFRDPVEGSTVAAGVVTGLAGTATEDYAGIVAATSVGGVQGGGAIGTDNADKAIIVGDSNSGDDNTVEASGAGGQDQIVVVVV